MSLIQSTAPPIMFPQSEMERTKGNESYSLEQEKARLKKATKEFESFFTYYMLKTMRQTIPDNALSEDMLFKNKLGKDIFNQMFDMELSRHITDGGGGSISEILYQSMERLIEAKYNADADRPDIKPLNQPDKTNFKPIKEGLPIDETKDNQLKELKVDNPFYQIRVSGRRVSQDSILADFGDYINSAAKATSLDPALIYSVIKVESAGDPKAVSPAGAKGLMQLKDSTAAELGVNEVFDPEENIKAGSRYLGRLIKRFGSLELGLAAYNAGPGTVSRYGGVPPFKETQQYIQKVTDTLSRIGQNREGHAKVKHY